MRHRIEAAGAESAYFSVVDEYGGVLEAQAQELEERAKRLRAEAAQLEQGAAIKRERYAFLRRRGFVLLAQARGVPTPPPEARVFREGDQGEVMVVEWESDEPTPRARVQVADLLRVPDLS